jgi:hypothetical protein
MRVVSALCAGIALSWTAASDAKPAYAEKEKKECGFCHVNPAGGGERNVRGQYYAKNKYSLVGLPVALKSVWKVEAAATARRIGIGDVMGDKKPRVLLLDAGEELAVLSVSEDKLVKDGAIKLGPRAGSFFVGNLEKGKPAVVVVPGAVHYRSGDTFATKSAPDLTSVTGTVRFEDGEECVFIFADMNEPAVFGVDSTKTNPLTVGRGMVLPDQGAGIYASVVARMAPEIVASLGWPEQAREAGVFGLWDARGDGNLLAWAPWADKGAHKVVFMDPAVVMGGGALKPTYETPNLAGKVLDVAVGKDPKGGKLTGMLLLLATGEGGKGRTLEFLALD